jgi:threonine dehydrogenase-like Zn-dependent dehydrogenase
VKGAERVIAVDHLGYRLNHAKRMNNVEVFDFTQYNNSIRQRSLRTEFHVGEASHAYEIFNGHKDDCIKVVLKP